MNICYCEDEVAQAELIKSKIGMWANVHKIDCKIDIFKSAEELLFKKDFFPYDLMLLDIGMNQMNGIELAKQIRKKDTNVRIVFITSDQTYVFDGYEVSALRYLMKPVEMEKLYELLEFVAKQTEEEMDSYIVLRVENETVRIQKKEVLYLEAQGHYVNIYCRKRGSIQVKESLSNIFRLLCENENKFIQCHRSYAVNLEYVEQISRSSCKLVTQIEVPISRSAYSKLNEEFIHYNLERKG